MTRILVYVFGEEAAEYKSVHLVSLAVVLVAFLSLGLFILKLLGFEVDIREMLSNEFSPLMERWNEVMHSSQQ